MSVLDKSERVSCPFDPVHVLERRRLQAHIIKCKRNLPQNHDFVQCKFWALHYVRRVFLEEHYAECEHSAEKQALIRSGSTQVSRFSVPKLVEDVSMQSFSYSEESWEDCSGPKFEPEKLMAKTNYMVVPQGMTPAQRKEHRDRERDRIREQQEMNVVKINTERNQSMVNETPTPRKPKADQVFGKKVPRPGRIVANFPVPLNQPEEHFRAASSSSGSFYTATESIPTVGRGRGILGSSRRSSVYDDFSHYFPKSG